MSVARTRRRPLVVRTMPRLIRIVPVHVLDYFKSLRPQVFLVNYSIVADDECLYAGDAVFCRSGNKAESTDHDALDYVIELAERRGRTLPLQHLEIVAVKTGLAGLIAFLYRLSNWPADGPARCSIGILPIQTIVLPGRTEDSLRILVHARIVMYLRSVFLLGLNKTATDLDCVQFVCANAP